MVQVKIWTFPVQEERGLCKTIIYVEHERNNSHRCGCMGQTLTRVVPCCTYSQPQRAYRLVNSHKNISALAWALSQHTDTSKNTKATIKCCYALHSYVGNHLHLLALYTMASILQKWRYVNSLKTACGYPCGRIINNHTRNPLTLWNLIVQVCAGWVFSWETLQH